MMAAGEGPLHLLLVSRVELPAGPLDDGTLDFVILHPASCGIGPGSFAAECSLEYQMRECGAPFTLRYSGTPIGLPGVYFVQEWWESHYVWDAWTDEHDGGVAVVEPWAEVESPHN